MLIFVIIFNLCITLVNLYLAWKIWKLRRVLARAALILNKVERRIHFVLYPAPEQILLAQLRTRSLSERYHELDLQIKKVRKILTLLSLGYKIWQRATGSASIGHRAWDK